MNIGLIGYGNVGKAFLKLIAEKKIELESLGINPRITYILTSKGEIFNKDGIKIEDFTKHLEEGQNLKYYEDFYSKNTYFEKINEEDFDYIIETTPTNLEDGEPGYSYIKNALERKINVITANKGPIALYYRELKKLAEDKKVKLGIGCTTGGALPTINAGLIDLAGAKIHSIEGVLKGTSNFILEEMEENFIDYTKALNKAQELRIAETDPSFDVEGKDSAVKLLILTNVLLGLDKKISDIEIKGITDIKIEDVRRLKEAGKRYKLVCRTVLGEDKVTMSVRPEIVSSDNIFYHVAGKNKGVNYKTELLGDLFIMGGASGTRPAAGAILRDLINMENREKIKDKVIF